MKFALLLSYEGTHYRGWQRQDKVVTVQESIETALSKVLKEPIVLVGCGRTDAGVHAHNFVAHFECCNQWDFDLLYRVNKLLSRDIVVHEVCKTTDRFNAQFNALERTYHYRFHSIDNPFLNGFSTFIEDDALNYNSMSQALLLLKKYTDFNAFCKTPDLYKTTLCKVTKAALLKGPSGQMCFVFAANRFLRSMIRILVFRLIKVGQNKLSLEDFERYFTQKQPLTSNEFAFPQGLVLSDVLYKDLDFNNKNHSSYIPDDSWTEVTVKS